jgi:hypothetical protein
MVAVYARANVGAGTHEQAQSKAAAQAAADWLTELNTRGAEGWELVTERFSSGSGRDRSGTGVDYYWAAHTGTMKRPAP